MGPKMDRLSVLEPALGSPKDMGPLSTQRLNESERTDQSALKQKFQEFVAGTFFKTLTKAMRKATPEGKLMHGGRSEQLFREHLDNVLATRMATSKGSPFSDAFFEQYLLKHSLNDSEVAAASPISINIPDRL